MLHARLWLSWFLASCPSWRWTALSPALAGLMRRGRVAPWALLAAVLRRPGLLGELVRLARDTRRAARRLAAGLDALLAGHGGDVVGE